MLYLLDANVIITAHNTYYPIDRVPEFWEWLQHVGQSDHVKIPIEILEEIKAGRKGKEDAKDLLYEWIQESTNFTALRLEEEVDITLVQKVVYEGYADDLADDEIEQLGRDPFLIAYAMKKNDRCVVTTEVSKPSKRRHNRRIPDVCQAMGVKCCGPFELNRALGFRTAWRR
ncbi:MAG: DUF4411 family protein [Candidatus Omnitrophota bacterium]|jgi:hypothetical protein|nr:MAG: DUF4411 family protein [Candidatus Omnitrophota bacterium]